MKKGEGTQQLSHVKLDTIDSDASFQTLTFDHNPSGIHIIQSCKGLLLCSSARYRTSSSEEKIYIYNPTTRQYNVLPPVILSQVREICGFYLAFDPSRSPY